MDANRAELLARAALETHGLTQQGWSFRWDYAKRRFGVCKYGPRVIGLSRPLVELNTEEQVRDTILHEVAHALVGAHARHGFLWQAQAVRLGARPERCAPRDVVVPQGAWCGVCLACGATTNSYRKPRGKRVQTACKHCCETHNRGRWDARYVFSWSRNV